MTPDRTTSRQVARGARADAEALNVMYLVKNCSTLGATYQIRLLIFAAGQTGKKLVLKVGPECRFSPALNALIKLAAPAVRRENY